MKDKPGKDLLMDERHPIIFASFAEDEEQLYHTLVLSESIRTFAGKFRHSPIWIFVPNDLSEMNGETLRHLSSLNVKIKNSQAPVEALSFFYARKVFAAAKAEGEAEGETEILVWMDEDTVVLLEPQDFALDHGVSFGYRPVMHKLIGSLYSEPPDAFWKYLYQKMSVQESSIFPMVTPADLKTIRPYFNAGLLVVRPQRGILRRWVENFSMLYRDPMIVKMCEQDQYKKIFLHQTALVGAALNSVRREEMVEFSDKINFPIFFKEMFGAEKEFDSIHDVVTLRHDVYFRNPDPNWSERLKGPGNLICWLKERLDRNRE